MTGVSRPRGRHRRVPTEAYNQQISCCPSHRERIAPAATPGHRDTRSREFGDGAQEWGGGGGGRSHLGAPCDADGGGRGVLLVVSMKDHDHLSALGVVQPQTPWSESRGERSEPRREVEKRWKSRGRWTDDETTRRGGGGGGGGD